MKKNCGGSYLPALGLGALIVLPFVLVYWAIDGDKEWKRVVGTIFTIVWILCAIFNPS